MVGRARAAVRRTGRSGFKKIAKGTNGSKPVKRRRNGSKASKVKISKTLAWIEKYLKRVERMMPTMTMPRAIRSFVPNPKKKHRTLGNCCIDDRTITLATHTVKVVATKEGKKRRVLDPISHLEILQTLAHELSHLAYGSHDYEQEWYGRTIFNAFGLQETCPHCGGKGRTPARYQNN